MDATSKSYLGDTVTVEAGIFGDEMGLTPEQPASVTWELADPDGNRLIESALPTSTIEGDIVILSQDSDGFNAWDTVQFSSGQWLKIAQAYNQLDDYTALLTVPGDVTDMSGVYRALVHFTLPGPQRKSQLVTFEVIDAFDNATDTPKSVAVTRSWMKLEDCFDSSLGGPWLRDMTYAFFNREKMAKLIPDAIARINYTFYPMTTFTEDTWDYLNQGPIFTQALLVETIYHLIRSYTEQPIPTGSPITWFNRTDYANRWKSILELEEKKLNSWLDIYKTQFFGFGAGSLLIGGYASTALRSPRALRTRLPRYYAGLYRRW